MRPAGSMDIFGFGEPDQDANAALNELDKGLRSTKVGDQCEAIVRFPALFERFPFPILINSAFLKLADVFRNGSNFLRLWILRVCQQSERHLDKISNVDEFVKKIFGVTHANDPIARALSLRTLGAMSGLIPERKAVHHTIRVALDSNDRVEVSAAIYAASCFAQKSKTFGTTMCAKISTMVQKLSTPLDLKLRLIPIFQHMHHDVATASTVRKLCQELLLTYPSDNFVITVLHTLTRLAAATISDLTEHVTFLLHHLDDERLQVKLSVLHDLKLLGRRGGHLWETEHISALINSLLSYFNRMEIDDSYLETEFVHLTLDVINSVTSASTIFGFLYTNDSRLWTLLETCTQSKDMHIVLQAIQIGTSITVNIKNVNADNLLLSTGTRLVGLIKSGMDALLNVLCGEPNGGAIPNSQTESSPLFLKKCLTYGMAVSRTSPSFCDWFCQTMGSLLISPNLSATQRNLICQSLGGIGLFSRSNIQNLVPSIIRLLQKWSIEQLVSEVVLAAIILQAHQGYSLQRPIEEFLKTVVSESNLWVAYRIARSSLRFGQPEIASAALKGMSTKVCSVNFYFWLSALESVAKAEAILGNQEITLLPVRLNKSSNLYLQAVSSLKAANSPIGSLEFQTEFVRLRSEMIISFHTFWISCGNLQFSPPPAIAPSIISGSNKDTLLASGRIVSQLRKSVRDFYSIGDAYGRLYQTAFDSDSESLLTVQILKQACLLMGRVIEKLVVPKDHSSVGGSGDHAFNFCFEPRSTEFCNSWTLIESCKQVVAMSELLYQIPERVITQQHVDCLKEAFRILIETPICFPRFFFQTLQTTTVKIAVSPQPRQPGEHISVIMGNQLALKVEGVIDQVFTGMKRGERTTSLISENKYFRQPKAIRVTVTYTPVQNPRAHSHGLDLAKVNFEPVVVSKDALPHRDFFTIQFLLGLWTSGITNVSIETSIIDKDDHQWITGQKASLTLKVYDEVSSKSQSQVSSVSGTTNPGSSRSAATMISTQTSGVQSQGLQKSKG